MCMPQVRALYSYEVIKTCQPPLYMWAKPTHNGPKPPQSPECAPNDAPQAGRTQKEFAGPHGRAPQMRCSADTPINELAGLDAQQNGVDAPQVSGAAPAGYGHTNPAHLRCSFMALRAQAVTHNGFEAAVEAVVGVVCNAFAVAPAVDLH